MVSYNQTSRLRAVFHPYLIILIVIVLVVFGLLLHQEITSEFVYLKQSLLQHQPVVTQPFPSRPLLDNALLTGDALDSPRTQSVDFYEHYEYQNLSHASDHLWDELLTPNGGFLAGLDDAGQPHRYGISMFHQLHCVAMLRMVVQSLMFGDEAGSTAHAKHGSHMNKKNVLSGKYGAAHNDLDSEHWLHCFDYLRQVRRPCRGCSPACWGVLMWLQAILCNADGTIELPVRKENGHEVVDGMVKRQCKNPDVLSDASIRSFAEARLLLAQMKQNKDR